MTKIWQKPIHSFKEVDRAGQCYVYKRSSKKEIEAALAVINNWREAHGLPLQRFRSILYRYSKKVQNSPKPLIAHRIKRIVSIKRKLELNDHMRLSQMQDIGGCRVVLKDVYKVLELRQEFKNSRIKHVALPIKDYINNPKETGYRAIHLIYKYKSNENNDYDDLRIEIQIRTQLQHIWATAVETVDNLTKNALKSNIGPQEWKRFFVLMSSVIAKEEGTPLVPNTPEKEDDLLKELASLSKKLKVEKTLEAFTYVLTETSHNDLKNATYFLIELDRNRKSITITGFIKADLRYATKKYMERENVLKAKGNEVVLVSVDKQKDLKKAYPNYYADTNEFLNILRKALKNAEKIEK